MFLVQVAAGRIWDAPKIDPKLVKPPVGYDSVRGTVLTPFRAVMAYALNQVRGSLGKGNSSQ
jgi:hypothetical protein